MATRYLVQWEMDIWADSPRNAAQQAWDTIRRHDSTANAFSVSAVDENTNQPLLVGLQVDLSETE